MSYVYHPRSENNSHIALDSSSFILTRRVRGFQRFFEMGQEESVSPFLHERGQRISKNLALKTAFFAAFFLFLAFLLRYAGYETFVPFLLSLVFLLVGSSALSSSIDDIFLQKDVNIDVLMTVAAFGALAMGNPMEGGLLLVLYELSAALEDVVTYRAKQSLLHLGEINPEKVTCVTKEGRFLDKSIHDIEVGQILLVRSGEIVPLDGKVVRGEGACSLAHVTGEEAPFIFSVGSPISSGAKVIEGTLQIQTEVLASESTLSKLIQLITRARSHKPALARLYETWGKAYAVSILALSVSLFFVLPIVFHLPLLGDKGAVARAVAFLIAASPCALILAVPISYVSALGSLVREGAILKGGGVLDQLDRCQTIAFDKTGTLTRGSFQVVRCTKIFGTIGEQEALSLLASLEQYAVHPLAQAIVQYAQHNHIPLLPCVDVRVTPGKGLSGKAVVGTKTFSLAAGCRQYMKQTTLYESLPGASEIFFSIGEDSLFVCFLRDTVRKESNQVIRHLNALHKRIVLLSGDKDRNVQTIASELGIHRLISEASPEEKMAFISSHLKEGFVMVGDGLNDAPALAQATVGISMGSVSSASAREASDVILLRDNLSLIPLLFHKAKQTKKVIRQNLFCAITALLGGAIAALGGAIPIWGVVLLHEGSTLLVGLNSLRLLAHDMRSQTEK